MVKSAGSRPQWSEFNLAKAAFEIVIVAVGVLLALLVDEAREARANRELANQARSAMRSELAENRSRFILKLDIMRRAYFALEADPSKAAELVVDRRNQQITPSKSAWVMTTETGALRLLLPEERSRYAMAYTAQEAYYDIVSQEMAHWADLAGYDGDLSPEEVRNRDKAIRLWKAWANRVSLGVCISTARIELAFNHGLPREKLWAACRAYRVTQPASELYAGFGLAMPSIQPFL